MEWLIAVQAFLNVALVWEVLRLGRHQKKVVTMTAIHSLLLDRVCTDEDFAAVKALLLVKVK